MKAVKAIVGVVVVLFLILVVAGLVSMENSPPSSNQPTTTRQEEPITEKITISNTKAHQTGSFFEILGEAKNNDTMKHSASLTATFYDDKGAIMGTATGFINDLAPGETKTFNLLSTDNVGGYSTFKVQIDSLL